jgi:hypothetical protein
MKSGVGEEENYDAKNSVLYGVKRHFSKTRSVVTSADEHASNEAENQSNG